VTIREQGPHDEAMIADLLVGAFRDDGRVAALAQALAARTDGSVSLLAEPDGVPIGHVQLSRGWVDAAPRLVEVLVLSPLGVAPAYQRRGVGRALCEAALEHARRLDAPAVFLEGDPGYYARLGWQRASAQGFTAPSARIPDAAFQVVLLPAWQPWMVGALVYNDTFWAHDCVGLRP
jgi:putative acetyltransferase